MNFLKLLLFIAAGFAPAATHALSLGDIVVRSGLAQPLRAEIPIPGATPEDLEGLKVLPRVAEASDVVLPDFTFSIARQADGSVFIAVTSTVPVVEPVVHLALDVKWASGRLVREYDLLLDPPDVHAASTLPPPLPTVPKVVLGVDETDDFSVTPPEDAPTEAAKPPVAATYIEEFYPEPSYGPVTIHDTLSDIAYKLRPRPEIRLADVMRLLFEQNPEAFFDNDMNRLKAGSTLRLKELSTLLPATDRVEQATLPTHPTTRRPAKPRSDIPDVGSERVGKIKRAGAVRKQLPVNAVAEAVGALPNAAGPTQENAVTDDVVSVADHRERSPDNQTAAIVHSDTGGDGRTAATLHHAVDVDDRDMGDPQTDTPTSDLAPPSGVTDPSPLVADIEGKNAPAPSHPSEKILY